MIGWPLLLFLGKPEAAPLLEKVCRLTQWRRMLGKHCGSTVQWTCTLKGTRGKVAGPLRAHLLATVNLVAWGYQDQALMLEEGPQIEQPAASFCAAPAPLSPAAPASSLPIASVPAKVHQAIKALRAKYVDFLKAKAQEMHWLEFNALLEDDHLSQAFLDAKDQGKDPATTLDMALKEECDSGPGHVCYFVPKGVEFPRAALGLDCCISITAELSCGTSLWLALSKAGLNPKP